MEHWEVGCGGLCPSILQLSVGRCGILFLFPSNIYGLARNVLNAENLSFDQWRVETQESGMSAVTSGLLNQEPGWRVASFHCDCAAVAAEAYGNYIGFALRSCRTHNIGGIFLQKVIVNLYILVSFWKMAKKGLEKRNLKIC